ncbi:MAG: DUF1302 domain-containing protein [Halioglobus sp.]|nr:DUF1302 domain-containing protein [Halioglobus sp.]|tara:strand:- start:3276 stop:5228 length:1953 start_codon:yes stop_codon:yes gene_type:complete
MKKISTLVIMLSGAVLLAMPVAAQEGEWDTAGFVENATYYRDGPGISKSRNTGQFEFSKDFGRKFGLSDFRVSGTLRGTYDATYDLNEGEFGDDAGGPRSFQNFGSSNAQLIYGGDGSSPWGQSILGAGAGPGFGFDLASNPNDGLKVLGEDFHSPQGGVTIGVPVRPCDEDGRGCGLDDYLDYDKNDLRFPEFNKYLDWIRELYLEGSIPTGDMSELFLRVGKQQVVWGRTDLFRVLDIINPVDYSRHNIYDELEDIRIPQWIATAEYRWGATDTFEDLNLQLVWNFDEFRPNSLGQGGTPYSILDAGSFFRAMNNCWENGCTVSNFVPAQALIDAGAPLPDAGDPGLVAADFGPGVIGIRQVDLPDWELDNTQGGIKLEGVYNSVGFSLNYYHFFQQLPVLRGGIEAMNPFTGEVGVWDRLIAFDIAFPEVDLFGGSLDFYVDPIKTVFRVEATYTQGEEFVNTLDDKLYSDSDMFRWVLGMDRNTFIPFLNKTRAFLISGQIFGEHMLDHELEKAPLGDVGIPNWEDNYTFTLLVKGWYKSDTISPQIITAWDYEAEAGTFAPSVDWLISDNWRLIFGANIKFGDDMGDQQFDDCRSCNPFPGFTGPPTQTGSLGLGGIEPLGRFRSGPLGSASQEDEIQLTLRYRF